VEILTPHHLHSERGRDRGLEPVVQ
jgi:hypothetical protein